MKKISIALSLVFLCSIANAQDVRYQEFDHHVTEIVATVFSFVLVAFFILAVIKRILDYRLKNKVIDKQVTEGMAMSVLGSSDLGESRFLNVKWFAILFGIGVGLLVVKYTQPLGIHSLAIMFLSISLSFLGYHFFLARNRENEKNRL